MQGATGGKQVLAAIVNDWQLSSIWTAATGTPYSVAYSYQNGGGNVNMTGSPDFGARVRIVGDPGTGCSSDQFAQFNAAAFQGPLIGSTGSSRRTTIWTAASRARSTCRSQREIPFGGGRRLQLRVDIFNAPNQAIVIPQNGANGRVTTLTLSSPSDPSTIVNNQFNADGTVNQTRLRPQNAGFGGANAWQNPRTVQAYIRFKFSGPPAPKGLGPPRSLAAPKT